MFCIGSAVKIAQRLLFWYLLQNGMIQNTYMWAVSWAMINALVNPSSLFSAQLLLGSHAPETGAYPDGPPISDFVNHRAISWEDLPPGKAACNFLFQVLTFSRDFLALPCRITLCFLCSYMIILVMTSFMLAFRDGSWYIALTCGRIFYEPIRNISKTYHISTPTVLKYCTIKYYILDSVIYLVFLPNTLLFIEKMTFYFHSNITYLLYSSKTIRISPLYPCHGSL